MLHDKHNMGMLLPLYFFSLIPSAKKYSPGASVVPANKDPIITESKQDSYDKIGNHQCTMNVASQQRRENLCWKVNDYFTVLVEISDSYTKYLFSSLLVISNVCAEKKYNERFSI